MERRQYLVAGVVVLLLLSVGVYLYAPQLIPGALAQTTSASSDSTPFGESLEISLDSGAETSGSASFFTGSFQGSESQNVYEVNSTYKSQELVTLEYSLSVTYSNVDTIVNVKTAITAIDTLDQSEYEYILASSKGLSGGSPIADSGDIEKSISVHLTDAGASVTSATIDYKIYCQVTAVGTTSGQTLTATIALTQFGTLVYLRTSESSQADVTPTVSVAGWADDLSTRIGTVVSPFLTWDGITFMAVGGVLMVGLIYVVDRKSSSSKKGKSKKRNSKGRYKKGA